MRPTASTPTRPRPGPAGRRFGSGQCRSFTAPPRMARQCSSTATFTPATCSGNGGWSPAWWTGSRPRLALPRSMSVTAGPTSCATAWTQRTGSQPSGSRAAASATTRGRTWSRSSASWMGCATIHPRTPWSSRTPWLGPWRSSGRAAMMVAMSEADVPGRDAVDRFALRVWQYKQGEVVSLMVHLGDRLGLYRALDGAGWVTPAALAAKTELNERWVREWLRGQAAAGLIDADGDATAFALRPEGALVLAREEDSLAFAAGAFSGGIAPPDVVDALVDAFRTGVGLT